MKISKATVFGTLERPVHAMNLENYMAVLRTCYQDDLIVAVDASVGNREHVGYVTLGKGALKPGLMVSRELRSVGIYSSPELWEAAAITIPYAASVRLSVVMQMADCISRSISLVEKFWDNTAFV